MSKEPEKSIHHSIVSHPEGSEFLLNQFEKAVSTKTSLDPFLELKVFQEKLGKALKKVLEELRKTKNHSTLKNHQLAIIERSSELEEENQKLHAHQAIIEKEWYKAVQMRERQAITIEHRLALFKQQQSQVAKVLKRTLLKLKETKTSLDIAKADLTAAALNEVELSAKLVEARREAIELRDFYLTVIQIVEESQDDQKLKEKLLEILGT